MRILGDLFLGLIMTLVVIGISFVTSYIIISQDNPILNSSYDVNRLFTKDGCTVYRFMDKSAYHYFINCNGSTIKNITEICGKNCYERYEETVTSSNSSDKK